MHHSNTATPPSNYKWYILALAALTHTFVVAIPTMALPVLFKEISDDLGLSLVQVGTIWGIGSLSGIFTGLIGGSIGDRFGAKRTLIVACILAGIGGALRGLPNSFITMSIVILLFGLITPAIPMNVHKTCGIWFSGKNLGLANGVVSAGMALGFMVGALISATVVSPWLGGWRGTLLLYGAVAAAMSIPWALSKEPPVPEKSDGDQEPALSMRQGFMHVFRLRSLWLYGLAILGFSGCVQGLLGYLPLYLRGLGWAPAAADGALSTFHAMSLIAAIPIALFSDRLGTRKTVLLLATVMTIIGVGMLSVVTGPLVWLAVVMAGVFRDGFMAIFMTSIIETKGVGAAFAGTATGFAMVFLQVGHLLAPPIGNSLAAITPSLPFFFWAVLAVVALVCFSFVREQRRTYQPPSIEEPQVEPS